MSTHTSIQSTSPHEPALHEGSSSAVEAPHFRYGLVLPIAAGATIGLLLSMASLVSAEFSPQDQHATPSFEINPVPGDLPPVIEVPKPDPLKQVEVPPPPPTLDITKVAKVDLPIIEVAGKIEPFVPTDITFEGGAEIIVADGEEQPIVRIPPIFPQRFMQGNYSGNCKVQFDVSAQGVPYNVEALSCTNRQLSAPTVKSVQKWKYKAKIQNGVPVSRTGLRTTVRFELSDERGKLLPLPNGA